MCVHPLSRLPVLGGVLVVAPVVALVETRRRLSPCSSLCPFASPFQFLIAMNFWLHKAIASDFVATICTKLFSL